MVYGNAQRTVFKGRAGINALQQGVPIVKEHIGPALSRFINTKMASTGFSSRTVQFSFPKTGRAVVSGSFTAQVGSVSLSESAEWVSVDALSGYNDKSARFSSKLDDVSVNLGGFTISSQIYFAPLRAGVDCGVSLPVNASIPNTSVDLLTEVDPASNGMTVHINDIQLTLPSFSLGALYLSGSCASDRGLSPYLQDIMDNPLATLVDTFFNTLNHEITETIMSVAPHFSDHVGFIGLPVLPPIDLSFLEGRQLKVVPTLTAFRVGGSPSPYLEFRGDVGVGTSLSEPLHRAGSSLSNFDSARGILPDPDTSHMINLHMSADGLNSIVESAWYMMWSTLATDASAMESKLCQGQAIETDYCPFPPFVTKPGLFTSVLLTLSSVLSLSPMRNWRFEVVAKPPSLYFEGNQSIQGTATSIISVYATRMLTGVEKEILTLSSGSAMSTKIPTYDSATALLSGVAFNSVRVDIDKLDFTHPLGFIGEWLLQGPLARTMNSVLNAGLPLVNRVIGEVLEKMPIHVPDVFIPSLRLGIASILEDTIVESIPSNYGTTGYLKFQSNLRFLPRFIPRQLEEQETPIQQYPETVFDTEAYRLASSRPYDSGETFTTSVTTPEGDSDTYILRKSEEGTILQLRHGEWILL